MKQKMDEFEESLSCISIVNSMSELKSSIKRLEILYKYAITNDNISSNHQVNNRNEDSKEEHKNTK